MKRDKEYYRQLGSKGGRATVEKHGRGHMSKIGKQGFQATTDKYFQGQRAYHLSWLRRAGAYAYFKMTGLSPKSSIDGLPIWGTKPPHPAHEETDLPF